MMQAKKEEGENSWTQIFAEISSKYGSNDQGSVIILGDEFCGKTSLIQRMTKKERPSLSPPLEYTFLNIQSDYNKDDLYAYLLRSGAPSLAYVNLPVYLLNGRTECTLLLKYAFPEHLSKCCIVLMAPLLPPENILPSLEKWYKVIEEKIKEDYGEKEIQAGKQAQIRFWQEYVEPLDTSMHNEHTSAESDSTLLPPEPNVLTHNCGAPIVVVLSKCDQYNEFTNDQLNRIQYHVRKFCINRGAALFYTSAKDDRNTQLLYKYLAHRAHNLPFRTPAYIVEHDSIFIPSGWDSIQKLEIVKEMISDLSLSQPVNNETRSCFSKESAIAAEEAEEQALFGRFAPFLNDTVDTFQCEPTIATTHYSTLTAQTTSAAAPKDAVTPIRSFFSNLIKDRSKTSTPKNAINFGGSDQSNCDGLTAFSSTSALSDQDMNGNKLFEDGDPSDPTPTTDYGNESQPNSARD